jgi:hypothetical protein
MSRNFKFLILINLILLVFLFISVKTCKNKEFLIQDVSNISSNRIELLNNKNIIQEHTIVENSKKIQKLLLENSKLKSISSQVKLKYITEIDSVIVNYTNIDTVYIKEGSTIKGLKIGTEFNKKDMWYSINGKIDSSGIMIDSLQFINDMTINIGIRRDGWFKTKKVNTEVINSNPYVSMVDMKSITVTNKDKLINKPWFTFLIGIGIGSLTMIIK